MLRNDTNSIKEVKIAIRILPLDDILEQKVCTSYSNGGVGQLNDNKYADCLKDYLHELSLQNCMELLQLYETKLTIVQIVIDEKFQPCQYFALYCILQQWYINQPYQGFQNLYFFIQDKCFSFKTYYENTKNKKYVIPIVYYHIGLYLMQLGFPVKSTNTNYTFESSSIEQILQDNSRLHFIYECQSIHFTYTKAEFNTHKKLMKSAQLICFEITDEYFTENINNLLIAITQVYILYLQKRVEQLKCDQYTQGQLDYEIMFPFTQILPLMYDCKDGISEDYLDKVEKFCSSAVFEDFKYKNSNALLVPFHFSELSAFWNQDNENIQKENLECLSLLLHQSYAFKISHKIAILFKDKNCIIKQYTNLVLAEGSRTGKTTLILSIYFYLLLNKETLYVPTTIVLTNSSDKEQPMLKYFNLKLDEESKKLNYYLLSSKIARTTKDVDCDDDLAQIVSNNFLDIIKTNNLIDIITEKIVSQMDKVSQMQQFILQKYSEENNSIYEQFKNYNEILKTNKIIEDKWIIIFCNLLQTISTETVTTKSKEENQQKNLFLFQICCNSIQIRKLRDSIMQLDSMKDQYQSSNIGILKEKMNFLMFDEICFRRIEANQNDNTITNNALRLFKDSFKLFYQYKGLFQLDEIRNKVNYRLNSLLKENKDNIPDLQKHLYISIINHIVQHADLFDFQLLTLCNVVFMKKEGVEKMKQMEPVQQREEMKKLQNFFGYQAIFYKELQYIIHFKLQNFYYDKSFLHLLSICNSLGINYQSKRFENLIEVINQQRFDLKICTLYSGTTIITFNFVHLSPITRHFSCSRSNIYIAQGTTEQELKEKEEKLKNPYQNLEGFKDDDYKLNVHAIIIQVPQKQWEHLNANYYYHGIDSINFDLKKLENRINQAQEFESVIQLLQGGNTNYLQTVNSQITAQIFITTNKLDLFYSKQTVQMSIYNSYKMLNKETIETFRNFLHLFVFQGTDLIAQYKTQKTLIKDYQQNMMLTVQPISQNNLPILAETVRIVLENFNTTIPIQSIEENIDEPKKAAKEDTLTKFKTNCENKIKELKDIGGVDKTVINECLVLMLFINTQLYGISSHTQLFERILSSLNDQQVILNKIYEILLPTEDKQEKQPVDLKAVQIFQNILAKDDDQSVQKPFFTVLQPEFIAMPIKLPSIERYRAFIYKQIENSKIIANYAFDKLQKNETMYCIIVTVLDKQGLQHQNLQTYDTNFKNADYLITFHFDDVLNKDKYINPKFNKKPFKEDYTYCGKQRHMIYFLFEVGRHSAQELELKRHKMPILQISKIQPEMFQKQVNIDGTAIQTNDQGEFTEKFKQIIMREIANGSSKICNQKYQDSNYKNLQKETQVTEKDKKCEIYFSIKLYNFQAKETVHLMDLINIQLNDNLKGIKIDKPDGKGNVQAITLILNQNMDKIEELCFYYNEKLYCLPIECIINPFKETKIERIIIQSTDLTFRQKNNEVDDVQINQKQHQYKFSIKKGEKLSCYYKDALIIGFNIYKYNKKTKQDELIDINYRIVNKSDEKTKLINQKHCNEKHKIEEINSHKITKSELGIQDQEKTVLCLLEFKPKQYEKTPESTLYYPICFDKEETIEFAVVDFYELMNIHVFHNNEQGIVTMVITENLIKQK